MGTVHRLGSGAAAVSLADAVEGFLVQVVSTPNTARSYRVALRALVAELGPDTPLVVLDQESTAERVGRWFTGRWGNASNAAVNARLDALRSAVAWWRTQDWITGDPSRRIRRRPRTPDRARALGRAEIETLLTRATLPLRERTLWRMLYETAAHTQEILSLDIHTVVDTFSGRGGRRTVVDGGYGPGDGARRWVAGAGRPPAAVMGVWWDAVMNHPVLTVGLLGFYESVLVAVLLRRENRCRVAGTFAGTDRHVV